MLKINQHRFRVYNPAVVNLPNGQKAPPPITKEKAVRTIIFFENVKHKDHISFRRKGIEKKS